MIHSVDYLMCYFKNLKLNLFWGPSRSDVMFGGSVQMKPETEFDYDNYSMNREASVKNW